MGLYVALLLALLSLVDTPLFLSHFTFFHSFSESFCRFRQYYEKLIWNKASRHQMFILFQSVHLNVSSFPLGLSFTSFFFLLCLSIISLHFLLSALPVLSSVCYQLRTFSHIKLWAVFLFTGAKSVTSVLGAHLGTFEAILLSIFFTFPPSSFPHRAGTTL